MSYEIIPIVCLLLNLGGVNPDSRIINGTNAAPGEFPQTVSVRLSGVHRCSGTFVDRFVVLTTAYCFTELELRTNFSVQYNTTKIADGSSAEYVVDVEEFIPHPDYTTSIFGALPLNDLGLLVLTKSITFDNFVKKVDLPQPGAPTPAYYQATVAGWGSTSSSGPTNPDLKKADVFVYTDRDCEDSFPIEANRTVNICAGVPQGGRGPCVGDTGDPLFVEGVQVGIASWVFQPCAQPGSPSAYTKVSTYVSWINNTVEELTKKRKY